MTSQTTDGRHGRCLLIALLVLVACDSSTDPGPQPHAINVSPNPVTIPQLGSQQLTPVVFDRDSALISGVTVAFTSSDTTIVRVSKGGMVSSPGPAGNASVTVRAGAASEVVPVTVTAVRSSISVTPNPITLPQKTTLTVDAKVLDAIGAPVPGATLTFTSSAPTLFTVSNAGVITSVGPAGVGNVRVEHDALQTLVPVAITQVPTSIRVSRSSILMVVGGQAQLTGTVLDANGDPVSGAALSYTSSNTDRVTVSNGGLVTSVGGTGSATITVQSGTLSATVDVQVVTVAHPNGDIVAQPFVGNAPWGVAISSADLVYVTTVNDGGIWSSTLVAPQFSVVQTSLPLPLSLAFTIQGTTAYASIESGVAIIDVTTGVITSTVTGFTGNAIFSIALSPDGETLAIGTANSLHLMDVATRTVTANFTTPGAVNGLAFTPDGNRLYASQFTADIVGEFNPRTQSHLRNIPAAGTPQGVAVSPDGVILFVAKEHIQQGLEVINLTTNERHEVNTGGGCFGLALALDGTEVWLACGGRVLAVDVLSRTVRTTVTTGGYNRRIAFSNSGVNAVVTNNSGNIYFID
ncbi:MAG TPA: hypothetical protein VK922_15795 [Gemmatimonadaceae bacterium]|nr:hypothetical protein [Gemmatimonadaceae bacterium]